MSKTVRPARHGSTAIYDGSGSDPFPIKPHHIPPLPPPGGARNIMVPPMSAGRRCLQDPQATEFIKASPRRAQRSGSNSRIRDTDDTEEKPVAKPLSREPTATPRFSPRSQADIVQFTSAIYFAGEGEAQAHIDLMRIGKGADKCSVEVNTREGSAKEGKFSPIVNRVVEFERGEVLKTFTVSISDDAAFDTTLEFSVLIASPQNCVLGRYLGTARVMILDDDIFPSNKFAKVCKKLATDVEAAEDDLSEVTGGLLREFMRFAFLRVPTLWWKTLLYLMLDQLHNAYYLMQIYIKMYLVDVVLRIDDPSTLDNLLVPGNRYLTAVGLAVMWAAPNVILLLVDRAKAGPLDCTRPLRVYLQASLFRKYLNYDSESQMKVPMQDLTVTMNSDIPNLVENGYQFHFALMRGIGKITIVGIFMLTKDWRTLVPFLVYPVIMFMFIKARQSENVELDEKLITAEAAAEGCIMSASDSFLLIRDYRMRNGLTGKFEGRLSDSFKANNEVRVFNFWNQQLVPWITLGCLCSYLALGAQLVILDLQSLGAFLAMLEIYKECGDRFQGIYDDLQRGVLAGSPLVQIVKMLNLPTDLHDRLQRNRQRRQYVKELMTAENTKNRGAGQVLENTEEQSIFDRIPLEVRDLKVPYVKAISNLKLKVPPEQVVYVTGCRESGKATLMHALTGIIMPARGEVIYASHSRVLNVGLISQVIPECDLYGNLTFGTHHPDPDRVRRIFKRLQLDRGARLYALLEAQIESAHAERRREAAATEKKQRLLEKKMESKQSMAWEMLADAEKLEQALLGHTTDDEESAVGRTSSGTFADDPSAGGSQRWYRELSFSELKRIHLARALVFNPELLVLHRPVDEVDTEDCNVALALLREFVDNRGVELDSIGRHTRRPRTVFFSGGDNTNARSGSSIADIVWSLDKERLQVSPGGRAGGLAGTSSNPSAPAVVPPVALATQSPEALNPVKSDETPITRTLSNLQDASNQADGRRTASEPPVRLAHNIDYGPDVPSLASAAPREGSEPKFREPPMTCWRRSCMPSRS